MQKPTLCLGKCKYWNALYMKEHLLRLSYLIIVGAFWLALSACSQKESPAHASFSIDLSGDWILEPDGSSMLDPQTSGLTFHQGQLYSISDGSAHESQIQRLHKIDPQTGAIIGRVGPIQLSPALETSCFVSYLSGRPDYEAIVSIPNEENAWLLVTEDATRSGEFSEACQKRFANTGSTKYPTLLVKIEAIQQGLFITGIRALQFSPDHQLGDFPNDGIEGMSISKSGKVLIGLEKDKNTQARIFEVSYTPELFTILDEFVSVNDSGLLLPKFTAGNHPINGMDVYYPHNGSQGYLIAAARNDDELWILDLNKQKATKVVKVNFSVNCRDANNNDLVISQHKIANTALEGVAVKGEKLYLINDPWKKVYTANSTCSKDQVYYERMSPMLFSLDIEPAWFQ